MTEEEYHNERTRILDDPRYSDRLRTWMLKELNRIYRKSTKKAIEEQDENEDSS